MATRGHTDLSGLYYPEIMVKPSVMLPTRAMTGIIVLLLPESVLMSMAYATTKGHGDVHGLCFSLNPNKCLWAVLSLGVSVESVLPPKVILLHEVWAVSEDLAYVHSLTTAGDYVCDLCCHQKPYGGP